MTLLFKVAKLVNGSAKIIERKEECDHIAVHYNRLNYWKYVPSSDNGAPRLWMFTLDLRTVSDVRIVNE